LWRVHAVITGWVAAFAAGAALAEESRPGMPGLCGTDLPHWSAHRCGTPASCCAGWRPRPCRWRRWVSIREHREAAELAEKLADKFVESGR